MDITTSYGVRLKVGRIPRKELDAFILAHPLPKAPVKKVTIWGGEDEIEDTNDPDYRREVLAYHLKLAHEQMPFLAQAIDIVTDWENDPRYIELTETEACQAQDKADYLRFVAMNEDDLENVVDEIFYQSTVTERGVDEASRIFNVTWYGQPIEAWRLPSTPGKLGRFFEDREAARFVYLSWDEFCLLSGAEQSAAVAHRRLSMRLDYLMSQVKR